MDDLDKLEEIFLTDVDDETRKENAEEILQWRKSLNENAQKASWVEHPITIDIIAQARKTYNEATILLGTNRTLDDKTKCKLWGQQDAALWILSFASGNPQAEIDRIKSDIKRALDITSTQ